MNKYRLKRLILIFACVFGAAAASAQTTSQSENTKPKRALTQSTPGYYPARPVQTPKTNDNRPTSSPSVNWSRTDQKTAQQAASYGTPGYSTQMPARTVSDDGFMRFRLRLEAGCGYVIEGPVMPTVTFGFSYYFTEGFYAGLHAGYHGFFFSENNIDATIHLVGGKPEIGYELTFGTDKEMAVAPFAAAEIAMPVSTTVKQNDLKVSTREVSICCNAAIGLRFSYCGASLALMANMPFGHDGRLLYGTQIYPSAALGYTF